MPNRNVEGNYRYKYQGKEVDPETGKEAFELRLWDSRIGRWLTIDPESQYFSPYLGMGNNPITRVDPNGGSDCPDPPCNQYGGDNGNSMLDGITLDEVCIGCTENVPSGSWGADAITTLGGFDYAFAGSTAQYQDLYPEFAGMNYTQMVSHFEANHGERFAQDYARLEAEFERQRQEELALHLMGVGRVFINMSTVVGLGGFKPARYTAPRPRLQPVTASNLRPSSLSINSKQLGKKWGKHKSDYPHMKNHGQYEARIRDVYNNPATKWNNYSSGSVKEIRGTLNGDLLRLKPNGEFISFYPGG